MPRWPIPTGWSPWRARWSTARVWRSGSTRWSWGAPPPTWPRCRGTGRGRSTSVAARWRRRPRRVASPRRHWWSPRARGGAATATRAWCGCCPAGSSPGVGCKRGTPAAAIIEAVAAALDVAGINPAALRGLASVVAKADEPGLQEAAEELGVSLVDRRGRRRAVADRRALPGRECLGARPHRRGSGVRAGGPLGGGSGRASGAPQAGGERHHRGLGHGRRRRRDRTANRRQPTGRPPTGRRRRARLA